MCQQDKNCLERKLLLKSFGLFHRESRAYSGHFFLRTGITHNLEKRLWLQPSDKELRKDLPDLPIRKGKEIQIPIHSFLQILFNAAMAERTARYEVLGLSGDGTL